MILESVAYIIRKLQNFISFLHMQLTPLIEANCCCLDCVVVLCISTYPGIQYSCEFDSRHGGVYVWRLYCLSFELGFLITRSVYSSFSPYYFMIDGFIRVLWFPPPSTSRSQYTWIIVRMAINIHSIREIHIKYCKQSDSFLFINLFLCTTNILH